MFIITLPSDSASCFQAVHPNLSLFILPDKSSSICHESCRECSLAPTDDLVRFWRSKVKVTAGCRGAKTSSLTFVASQSILFSVLDGMKSETCIKQLHFTQLALTFHHTIHVRDLYAKLPEWATVLAV